MAKAELKIDIEHGPALKALTRMVGAFGSGVQPGTEQSAALIEAYTCIQNAMVAESQAYTTKSSRQKWSHYAGAPALIEFLKRNADKNVRMHEISGTEIAGRLVKNTLAADHHAFYIVRLSCVHYPITLEAVEWIECVE